MKRISRTCIAAIKTRRNKIIMAGDRRASWDWSFAQSMPRPKIEKRNDLLLGATGDGFLCTLLVNIMDVPAVITNDLDTYMFKTFRGAVYRILQQNNLVDKHSGLKIPKDINVELLVGIYGHLYTVSVNNPDPDSQLPEGIIAIDEVGLPFAVGCGSATAIPVLLAEKRREGYSTKEHLQLAMDITAEVSPGCDNKIDFISE